MAVKKKKGRPSKTKANIVKVIVIEDETVLATDVINTIQDRMLTYRRSYAACPICKAQPVICTMKRVNYRSYRCRECGHRWEVTE